MWEPREAGRGGAALSTFPASSPLGGLDGRGQGTPAGTGHSGLSATVRGSTLIETTHPGQAP